MATLMYCNCGNYNIEKLEKTLEAANFAIKSENSGYRQPGMDSSNWFNQKKDFCANKQRAGKPSSFFIYVAFRLFRNRSTPIYMTVSYIQRIGVSITLAGIVAYKEHRTLKWKVCPIPTGSAYSVFAVLHSSSSFPFANPVKGTQPHYS